MPGLRTAAPWRALARAVLLCAVVCAAPAARAEGDTRGVHVDIVGASQVVLLSAPVQAASRAVADNLQRVREGEDFRYVIHGLPQAGQVRLELGFTEPEHAADGLRVFDVDVNEREALRGFDVFAEAGGMRRAVLRQFTITPREGVIDIHFRARTGRALVGFIRLEARELNVLIRPQVSGEPDPGAGTFAPWNRDTGEIIQDAGHRTWRSGVPFGGIGTGKIEVLPGGDFANITINNAWDRPLDRMRGSFFAVVAKSRSGRGTGRILRVPDPGRGAEYPDAKSMTGATYRGAYPFAEWEFRDDTFPLRVRMKGFSPVVPGMVRESSLPVAMFDVELTNPNKFPVAAGVAFSWHDVSAQLGRAVIPGQVSVLPQVVRAEAGTSTVVGIRLAAERPVGGGMLGVADYFVGAETSGTVVTHVPHWDPSARTIPWWAAFEKSCRLERRGGKDAVPLKSRPGADTASVVCASVNLAPQEVRTVPFLVTWYVPEVVTAATGELRTFKQDYTTSFASSVGVAGYATANRGFLRRHTEAWHAPVMGSNLPQWLRMRIVNALHPLVANTLLLDGGRFTMLESTDPRGGRVGNLEFGLLANPFLSTFFPELVASELDLFAAGQDVHGRIPDSLGTLRQSLMVPGFVPVVDRLDASLAFLLHGATVADLAPDAPYRRAVDGVARYALGLVDRTTTTAASGTARTEPWLHHAGLVAARDRLLSGTATLPAGPIAALEEAAGRDAAFAAGLAADASRGGHTVANGLRGAWLERALGIGPGMEMMREADAVTSLLNRHEAPDWPLPAMLVDGDGAPTTSPVAMGLMEAYLGCLAITAGRPDDGLAILRRCHQAAWGVNHDPWNQSLAYDPVTGRASGWPGHVSAFAAWNALASITGASVDWERGVLYLDPSIPKELDGRLRAPVFDRRLWAEIGYDDRAGTATVTVLRVMRGDDGTTPTLKAVARRRAADGAPDSPVVFPHPLEVVEGETLRLDTPF